VILNIAGREVRDAEALRYRPATREKGEEVEVGYLRDGRERRARVRLELPPEVPARNETQMPDGTLFQGITVANLSPALNEELGRNPFDTGVVVTSADPRRTSRRTPLRPGVMVLEVGGFEIASVDDLERALRQRDIRTLTIRTPRGRVSTYRVR
jgi:serine protease Do